MAKDPAVLFYTSDFLAGVAFFSMEQRGQYITLLCEQHQHYSIPKNHMILVCGSLDSPVIGKFTIDQDGNYYNERMRDEAIKRSNFCKSRSNNKSGRRSSKSYDKSYDKSYENHMSPHMGNGNGNRNKDKDENKVVVAEIYPTFDDFWNLYDKKVGNKSKISSKWNKLRQDIKEKAMLHIEEYKASQPNKQYRKNPETYLNNESWNDEIIIKQNDNDRQNNLQGTFERVANELKEGGW